MNKGISKILRIDDNYRIKVRVLRFFLSVCRKFELWVGVFIKNWEGFLEMEFFYCSYGVKIEVIDVDFFVLEWGAG